MLKLIGVFAILLTVILPTVVQAHDGYLLSFTIDYNSRQITPNVTFDENNNRAANHAERDGTAGVAYFNVDGRNIFDTNDDAINGNTVNLSGIDDFSNYPNESGNDSYNHVLPFTFPGRHVGTGAVNTDGDMARDGNAADQEQAIWVGQNLSTGFNQVVNAIYAETNESGREHYEEIIIEVAEAGASIVLDEASSVDVRGFTFSSGGNGSSQSSYIDDDNYVHVLGGGVEYTVPAQVPKGYGQDQRLWPTIENSSYGSDEEYYGADVAYIRWDHMVLQALTNSAHGITTTNVEELNPPGWFERQVLNLFSGLTGGIRGILGLEAATDLVFIEGNYGQYSYMGVMPMGLGTMADTMFYFTLVIAAFILIGAFISLYIRGNMSIVNPRVRVELKDAFMGIFGALFILTIFPLLWSAAMDLNYAFVNYFQGFSENSVNFGNYLAGGSGSIAAIIISIAWLVVEIWFNTYYIVRAITVALLYVFAPIFIISLAFGGKYSKIFGNFLKEILGALFIQSIHAAVIAFLSAAIDMGSPQSGIWSLMMLLSVIPLSNMLRKQILGLGGDSIGSTAARGEKGMMMGAMIGGGAAVAMGGAGLGFLKDRYESKKSGGAQGGPGGPGGGTNMTTNNTSKSSEGQPSTMGDGTGESMRDFSSNPVTANSSVKEGIDSGTIQRNLTGGGTMKDKIKDRFKGDGKMGTQRGAFRDKNASGLKQGWQVARNTTKGVKDVTMDGAGKAISSVSNNKYAMGALKTGATVAGATAAAGMAFGDMSTEEDSGAGMIAGKLSTFGALYGNRGGGRRGDKSSSGGAYFASGQEYTGRLQENDLDTFKASSAQDNAQDHGIEVGVQEDDMSITQSHDTKEMMESNGASEVDVLPSTEDSRNGETRAVYEFGKDGVNGENEETARMLVEDFEAFKGGNNASHNDVQKGESSAKNVKFMQENYGISDVRGIYEGEGDSRKLVGMEVFRDNQKSGIRHAEKKGSHFVYNRDQKGDSNPILDFKSNDEKSNTEGIKQFYNVDIEEPTPKQQQN